MKQPLIRIALILFIGLLTVASKAGETNPFSKLSYDKVVFYDFETARENGYLIIDTLTGKFRQKVIKKEELDLVTIKVLNRKLNEERSYGGTKADCFDPHCGFVYFLKNKPVAQVIICVSCNRLYSTLHIPAQKQGKQGEGSRVYYLLDGLSKTFRQTLNEWLKKYNFSHQITPGSIFD